MGRGGIASEPRLNLDCTCAGWSGLNCCLGWSMCSFCCSMIFFVLWFWVRVQEMDDEKGTGTTPSGDDALGGYGGYGGCECVVFVLSSSEALRFFAVPLQTPKLTHT